MYIDKNTSYIYSITIANNQWHSFMILHLITKPNLTPIGPLPYPFFNALFYFSHFNH